MAQDWKQTIDPTLRTYLETLILESQKHRNSYSNSKNKANAQLWIANAILSKQVTDLNLKVKFLEKALQELSPGKSKKTSKEDETEIKKILSSLQKM
ncbi:hypothetical protein J4403_00815 [Candidatus Woesearchaeota archaeon]|nr:hypothetical protein [Candidatus Woesearchaeota archaeon]